MNTTIWRNSLFFLPGLCLMSGLHAQQPGQIEVGHGEITYYAQDGDTLSTIAQTYTNHSANWVLLSKRNRIANDRKIPINTGILIPAELLPEQIVEAKIAAFSGDSTLATNNGAAIEVSIGMVVREGMIITTGKNGFVTLALPDNSRVSVPSNSKVRLSKLRMTQYANSPKTELTLLDGRVESTVSSLVSNKGRFEVRSPLAIAGVRGTHFRVGITEQGTASEVLEGNVAVGQSQHPATVSLPAGTGNMISATTVGHQTPLLPAPILAESNRLQERPTLKFTTTLSMPLAHAFRAQIAVDAKAQNLIQEGVFSSPTFKFSGLDDGQYFLRVTGIDANGLEGLPQTIAFTLKARPEPPLAVEPGKKIRSSQVNFVWSEFQGSSETGSPAAAESAQAASYHLQIARDAEFKLLAEDQSHLVTPQFSTDKLLPGHYFWRVATVVSKRGQPDQGPYGDVEAVDILPPPKDLPALADSGADTLSFGWPSEPGQHFLLEIGRNAAFSDVLLKKELDVAEITLPRPDPGTYFVRIKATDADGYVGPYSSTQKLVFFSRWVSNFGIPLTSSGGVVHAGF